MNLNRDSSAAARAHSNDDDEETLLAQRITEIINEK